MTRIEKAKMIEELKMIYIKKMKNEEIKKKKEEILKLSRKEANKEKVRGMIEKKELKKEKDLDQDINLKKKNLKEINQNR
jgi:hypothetical protein